MTRKVYLETSVISYLTARPSRNVIEAGHQQSTYLFWDKRGEFDLSASELVLTECAAGDPEAASKRLAAIDRSHAPRGNADSTAPAVIDAERHHRHSHGDRGNDVITPEARRGF